MKKKITIGSSISIIFCYSLIFFSPLSARGGNDGGRGDHGDHDHDDGSTEQYELYDRTTDNADFNPYDYPSKNKPQNTHHMQNYYEDPDSEGGSNNNYQYPRNS